MNAKVICTSWNARLEGDRVVVDVGFTPSQQVQQSAYGIGAAIGSPNSPSPVNLPEVEKPLYTVVSGPIQVSIRSQEAAKAYVVGNEYQLSVEGVPVPKSK